MAIDVMIVGGGPAGLSAALLLGRCLRHVVICDAGHPRNERSPAMHGFLGFDGIAPRQFLERARSQLECYDTVSFLSTTITEAIRYGTGFLTRDDQGREWISKTLLLASGLIDKLPEVPGIETYYGTSVHSCPYCDAWERRRMRLGVIGADESAMKLAQELLLWSDRVALFTNRPAGSFDKTILRFAPIEFVEGRISTLRGNDRTLEAIEIAAGCAKACDALFFFPSQVQHSPLAEALGCDLDAGEIACHADGCTNVQGLLVAGNASKGVQMAIVAAAEGVTAGAAINDWLLDFEQSYLAELA